jgi:DNA uptake protein ComE-like DNA-binding protein
MEFLSFSDLEKVYGVDTRNLRELVPYMRFPKFARSEEQPPEWKHREPKKVQEIFDLNIADSSELESLPGIGPVLAKRIILYRGKLGGFRDIDQLAEVYGLKSEAIDIFRDRLELKEGPDKIDLNKSTEYELSRHPYINRNQAKAIVNFRLQHGDYSNMGDLMLVKLISAEDTIRLKHYIDFYTKTR